MFGNIEVHHGMDCSLEVCLTGGPIYNEDLIKCMYTAFKIDLWKNIAIKFGKNQYTE